MLSLGYFVLRTGPSLADSHTHYSCGTLLCIVEMGKLFQIPQSSQVDEAKEKKNQSGETWIEIKRKVIKSDAENVRKEGKLRTLHFLPKNGSGHQPFYLKPRETSSNCVI